jgi:dTDP-glucose 4,6-dehydratase
MNKVTEEDFDLIYSHTKKLWDKLSNSTIFITGATGFFGKCLLKNFLYANSKLNLNIKIVALSRNPAGFILNYPEFNNSSIIYIKGDVKDFEFPEQNIDHIIHAATDVNMKLIIDEPLTIYDTIVDGTKHVLEFAKQKKIRSVLYISSGAIYGKQPHALTHVTEEFIGSPDINASDVSYGEGKRVAEILCHVYNKQHGVNTKIARCYSFVGSYLPLDGHFAIGNFIQDVINNKQIKIQGDGSPYRAYLYTADLVIWLLTILLEGKNCYPYNVGSDEAINLEDLANTINTFSKEKLKIEIMKAKTDAPASRYVPSIERAKDELGLKVYTNLKEAIDKTIRFYTLEKQSSIIN